jgi:ribosomal protein RSM22 (predicted rRNA methylase)
MIELDWDRLQRLRDRFLATGDTHRAIPDYWLEPADLQVYDQVLAERIGWKWDAVLAEIEGTRFVNQGPALSTARILDWGCGTGIASRRFLARFGSQHVQLHDRSKAAMDFAAQRLLHTRPNLEVELQPANPTTPDVLLLSHVLGELSDQNEAQLLELVQRCQKILWVEPGTHAIARRLSAIRDRLLNEFDMVAPCPHQSLCSALQSGPNDWCHFFAKPPSKVFMDSSWVEIGRRLKIDLRALPYHFLAMVRSQPGATSDDQSPTSRLIGRPQVRSKFVRFYQCDKSGMQTRTIFKGREPDLYKKIKKSGAL